MIAGSWLSIFQDIQLNIFLIIYVIAVILAIVVALQRREWGFLCMGAGFACLFLYIALLMVGIYLQRNMGYQSELVFSGIVTIPGWLFILLGIARIYHRRNSFNS